VLAAIAREGKAAIAHYPDPTSRQLRQALAEFYQLDPDWILVGNGAAELFTWAARDCAATCQRTIVPVPAFADYCRALKSANATWEALPCWDADAARPISWHQHLIGWPDVSSSDALFLNTPHNPTGQCWSRTELLDLLPHFQLVVADEAFMDFVPASETVSLLHDVQQFPHLVVVRSLTKFFAIPGLRLGFAVGHPDRLARWQEWRDPWSVNGFATVAAIAALQDRDFQQRTLAWLPTARQQLTDGLAYLPDFEPYPSAANFLLVRSAIPVPPLQHALLEQHRIAIRDCLSFAELGDRYFRVAIRTEADNLKLLRSLENLLATLRPALAHRNGVSQ
jgi:histidinol-phosphate/aromatic aminotransferase/cobyric acid decarboxylase-like protein